MFKFLKETHILTLIAIIIVITLHANKHFSFEYYFFSYIIIIIKLVPLCGHSRFKQNTAKEI